MVALKPFSDKMDESPLSFGEKTINRGLCQGSLGKLVKGPTSHRVVVLTDCERTNPGLYKCLDHVYKGVRPPANISNYLSSHVDFSSVFLILAMQYDCGYLIITKAVPNCPKS